MESSSAMVPIDGQQQFQVVSDVHGPTSANNTFGCATCKHQQTSGSAPSSIAGRDQSSRLPAEVMDFIFEELFYDKKALKTCCLVSERWRDHAIRHLYQEVVVTKDNSARLGWIYRVGHCVKRLRVYDVGLSHLKVLRAQDYPNLLSITMIGVGFLEEYTIREGFLGILPQLQHLELEECSFRTLEEFEYLILSRLVNIEHLEFDCINFNKLTNIGSSNNRNIIPPTSMPMDREIVLKITSYSLANNGTRACAQNALTFLMRDRVELELGIEKEDWNERGCSAKPLIDVCCTSLEKLELMCPVSTSALEDANGVSRLPDLAKCTNLREILIHVDLESNSVIDSPSDLKNACTNIIKILNTLPDDIDPTVVVAIHEDPIALRRQHVTDDLCNFVRKRRLDLQVYSERSSRDALITPQRQWRQHHLDQVWQPLVQCGKVSYVSRALEPELLSKFES